MTPDRMPDVISLALEEDIGSGDVTVEFFTRLDRLGVARIVARQDCCLAGGKTAAEVFRRVDAELVCDVNRADGDALQRGDVVLEVRGRVGSILTAERTALNFIQRLSGVATVTRNYVRAVEGTGAVILDTRKTTPGLRLLEKAAVLAGGGTNHRMGLHDMVMVKDNHLAAGDGFAEIQSAIDRLKKSRPGVRVELEADTLDQVFAFYHMHGVDVILLDNMTPEMMRKAVGEKPPHIRLEASGGITLSNIRAVAETGVDFISIGALTHSAPAVDFSLEMDPVSYRL